jgi:hypothetical protein
VWDKKSYHTKASTEFIKNLTSVDMIHSTLPRKLYRLTKQWAVFFLVFNFTPGILLLISTGLVWTSLIAHAVLTLLAWLIQFGVIIGVIFLVIYNSRHKKYEVAKSRVISFLLGQSKLQI